MKLSYIIALIFCILFDIPASHAGNGQSDSLQTTETHASVRAIIDLDENGTPIQSLTTDPTENLEAAES